jgi:hypothetical protein
VDVQAAVSGYNTAFLVLLFGTLSALPLLLFVGKPDKLAPAERAEAEGAVIAE